ncbi:MAG: acyl-CoA thioesterase [Myxococcales bacterium]|nr:acyl-CoA thioesterase [Myxococcales bacterium]
MMEKTTGELTLRFEDIAQDGRLMLEPLPAGLTPLWRVVEARARGWLATGSIPIINRITAQAGDGPFGMEEPLQVEGAFSLAHTVDEAGQVQRLVFDADVAFTGKVGRTTLAPPDDVGRVVPAGSLRVEHVFTRPFAPKEERRVTFLEEDGQRFVPPARRVWKEPRSTLDVPEGARPLGEDFVRDEVPLVLGLTHTDSNQHVNSLFYPRSFEDAALRHLKRLGRSTEVLGRRLDIAFRRPSFAGEVLHVHLRAYEVGRATVCTGVFVGEGEPPASARVYVQLSLE